MRANTSPSVGADWFQVDRAFRPDPDNPRDPGSLGPEAVLPEPVTSNKPGCYEAPLGLTVNELNSIETLVAVCGRGGSAKAVNPRRDQYGDSWLPNEFDCPLDFRWPRSTVRLSSVWAQRPWSWSSMIPPVDGRCAAQQLRSFLRTRVCGQCTPCREGTSWALKMMAADQGWSQRSPRWIWICSWRSVTAIGIMPGTTICGLADGAAWPTERMRFVSFATSSRSTFKRTNPRGIPAAKSSTGFGSRGPSCVARLL